MLKTFDQGHHRDNVAHHEDVDRHVTFGGNEGIRGTKDEFFDAPSSLSEQTGVEVEWEVRYDPVHQHPYPVDHWNPRESVLDPTHLS